MDHWQIVRSQAIKMMESNSIWTSFLHNRRYEIKSVDRKKILIKRLSGGKDAFLTEKFVNNTISKIITGQHIRKSDIRDSVAKKAAIIYLHPFVHFDKEASELYWQETNTTFYEELLSAQIENIPNDNLQKIEKLIRQRPSQVKFKKSLLKAYDQKCCISGCEVEELLEAAHIEPHSESGNNSIMNGLLLRVDLHKLFDTNNLGINPKTLKVHLNRKIRDKYYKAFEGRKIASRNDNISPSADSLKKRWNEFQKT